jgi:hypothetical protein
VGEPAATSRRNAVILVVVIALGLALGAVLLRSARTAAGEEDLRERCSRIDDGNSVDQVFERLGLEGYLPGCGGTAPCQEADLGPFHDVPWLCDLQDCSLRWRVGAVTCFVDLVPERQVVIEVVLMDHSDSM